MKIILLLGVFIMLFSCSKPKSVFICGDHECINRDEAQQYFEDNLTLEVKIIDKKRPKEKDLVKINLNSNYKKKN